MVAAAGCGADFDAPAAAAAAPGDELTGDLAEARSALMGTGGAGGAVGSTADPKVIYLFYADGSALPSTDVNACKGTAPAFKCNFGTSLSDCQHQVQSYLDRWYADFNVVFTLTRPKSGPFYTEVVSSGGGAWCGVDAKVAGVAPFLCKDIDGGVAYTFMGGDDAKQTAVIIAQEQAHLVGLEHTTSPHDLMLPTICSNCDGFEDAANTVKDDRCSRPTQNSYQMMKQRLGVWGGGPKPSAFGCQTDSPSPMVLITQPADKSTVASDFTVKVTTRADCAMTHVDVSVSPQILHASSTAPPFEWDLTNITGTQTITVTATDSRGKTGTQTITVTAPGTATPPDEGGGCSVAPRSPGGAGWLAVLALGVAAAVTRRRR